MMHCYNRWLRFTNQAQVFAGANTSVRSRVDFIFLDLFMLYFKNLKQLIFVFYFCLPYLMWCLAPWMSDVFLIFEWRKRPAQLTALQCDIMIKQCICVFSKTQTFSTNLFLPFFNNTSLGMLLLDNVKNFVVLRHRSIQCFLDLSIKLLLLRSHRMF